MRSATLLAAGSWALALLVGFFIWVSPDSGLYPSSGPAAVVVGLAFLLWSIGAFATGLPRSAPKLSLGAQLGAAAPMIAAAIALVLAGRGLLPHPVLPLLMIILGGGAGWWWGRRASPEPTTRRQELAIVLTLIPVVLITVPGLLLAVWGQQIWQITAPNYTVAIERYNSVNGLTPYRPRALARITPEAAGRALVAIASTGVTARPLGLVAVPGSSARPWLPDGGPFAGWSGDSVMEHALRGLTREERTWLVQVSDHPGLPLLDSVAYAERLDPWAALSLPVPDGIDAISLPVPSMITVRQASRLQLYRAALAMADHRSARADSLARGMLGFGLRLRDDADQLLEALVGVVIARDAARTLARIRRASGKRADGDALLLLAPAPGPASVPADTLDPPRRPMQIREEIITSLLAHASPRPVEWDLAAILGYSRCTNLREAFYGPSGQAVAAFDAVASRLRNSSAAQEAFGVVRRGFHPAPGDRGGAFRWLTGVVMGRAQVVDCLSLGSLLR